MSYIDTIDISNTAMRAELQVLYVPYQVLCALSWHRATRTGAEHPQQSSTSLLSVSA